MSKREPRKETLSVRINREVKAGLSIAANYSGESMATVMEQALVASIQTTRVSASDVHGRLADAHAERGSVPISKILYFVQHHLPEITMLRLFYLFPKGLTDRERTICEAVVANPAIFAGSHPLFVPFPDPGVDDVPLFDVQKLSQHMPSLKAYAQFVSHNSQRSDVEIAIDYPTYLELAGKRQRKEGEQDELSE